MSPNPNERETYTTRVAKRPEYYIVIYSLRTGQMNFGPIFEKIVFLRRVFVPPWGRGNFFLGKPRGFDQNEKNSPTIAFVLFQISINFVIFNLKKWQFSKKIYQKKRKEKKMKIVINAIRKKQKIPKIMEIFKNNWKIIIFENF